MPLDHVVALPRRSVRRRKLDAVALADRARDAGQWEVATQLYRKALDRNPRNPAIWVQYGHALKEYGELRDPDKLAQAEIAYRAALSLNSGVADTFLQLGHVLKLRGEINEATACYLRAFALDSAMPYPLEELSGLGWSKTHISEVRELVASDVEPNATLIPKGTPTKSTLREVGETESAFLTPAAGGPTVAVGTRKIEPLIEQTRPSPLDPVERDIKVIHESGLFDESYYRANVPDLRADADAVRHFVERGSREGRMPNRMFDPAFYLNENPDVAQGGQNPLVHFIHHGAGEGRRPHRYFDPAFYLAMHPDVARAGYNPLLHYLLFGEKEGRKAYAAVTDAEFLTPAAGGPTVTVGTRKIEPLIEQTRPFPLDPVEGDIKVIHESGLFDESYYRANVPDLRADTDAVRHFVERGSREGRMPNRMFDPAFYLSENPDVARGGHNPLEHFIHHGAGEGRRPHRYFDPAFYSARYPDVARAGYNPLLHYLLFGEKEGRKAYVAVTDAEIHCLKPPSFRDAAAVLAAHSPHGRLKPHLRHYINSLKRQGISVVLIVNTERTFTDVGTDLVGGLDGIYIRRAQGYDFAAWAHLLHLHPELFNARILYLLNDSVIGPTNDTDFRELLSRVRNTPADLIGLTESFERAWHIQTYFLALKPLALSSAALHKFFDGVISCEVKVRVIDAFEIQFASILKTAGLNCVPLFGATDFRNPTLFHWKHLLESGFPFVKVQALLNVIEGVDTRNWRELLTAHGYDLSLAEQTLADAKTPSEPEVSSSPLVRQIVRPPAVPAGVPLGPASPSLRVRSARAAADTEDIGSNNTERNIEVIRDSGLFDEAYYRANNPDLPTDLDAVRHFVVWGAREGRMPNRRFDPAFYLRQNNDVAQNADNPLVHFIQYGAGEGRRPHPYFDPVFYLARYPDVAGGGHNPLLHYLLFGEKEGRIPAELSYDEWCQLYDTVRDGDRLKISTRLDQLQYKPLISVLLWTENSAKLLQAAVSSVVNQLYKSWELWIAMDPSKGESLGDLVLKISSRDQRIKVVDTTNAERRISAMNAALEAAEGEFIVFIDDAGELSATALYMIAEVLNENRRADLIYSDEDWIDASGHRYKPNFKPDWNPDLFYGWDYLGNLIVCRTSLVREVGGVRSTFDGGERYDLVLRIIEKTTANLICHVPFILYHRRSTDLLSSRVRAARTHAANAERHALSEHFFRIGQSNVEVVPGPSCELHRIVRPVPHPQPLVSLVIPTGGKVDLLSDCVSDMLNRTEYDNIELIILYNTSTRQEAFAYFNEISADPRVTIVDSRGPFNFARICNIGVKRGRGEIIALINDDIKVIEPGWLKEMVGHAVRPEVGAVGAMLYYPNDTVQHAGVILGLRGGSGHIHRGLPRGNPGYFYRAALTQDLSCVTAACQVLRREVYREVGGYDENLAVDFNDVDFCLKIRSKGYLIIWTPFSELYHLESVTRGESDTPERRPRLQQEIDYLKDKWGPHVFDRDPYFNPNLRLDVEHYEVGPRPRIARPWLNMGDENADNDGL